MNPQRGFSLVEAMISMTIAMLTLSTLASVIAQGISFNTRLFHKAQLTDELGAAFELMQQDLRRAGSVVLSAKEWLSSDTEEAFRPAFSLGKYPGETPNSCVLLRYDVNGNGKLDQSSPNERMGYRLNDNSLEMRQNGLGCEAKGWQDITDKQMVRITQLHFSVMAKPAGVPGPAMIQLTLSGQSVQHSGLTAQLQRKLMINNAYIE